MSPLGGSERLFIKQICDTIRTVAFPDLFFCFKSAIMFGTYWKRKKKLKKGKEKRRFRWNSLGREDGLGKNILENQALKCLKSVTKQDRTYTQL